MSLRLAIIHIFILFAVLDAVFEYERPGFEITMIAYTDDLSSKPNLAGLSENSIPLASTIVYPNQDMGYVNDKSIGSIFNYTVWWDARYYKDDYSSFKQTVNNFNVNDLQTYLSQFIYQNTEFQIISGIWSRDLFTFNSSATKYVCNNHHS